MLNVKPWECQLEQLERLRSEDNPRRLMIIHTIESYWIRSQKKKKKSPKFQIFEFCNGHYMPHTFWSCLIRCANMKWIRWVLLKIQSGHDSVHRRTSFSMNKPTTWCKSGRVSLVSSSCLYKTQPERALAQVWIDALSPDEYQFHLLLHQNSHHSQATYPKWLNH